MRDSYIDDGEIVTYSDHYIEQVKQRKGLGPALPALAKAVGGARDAVKKASATVGTIREGIGDALPGKKDALKEGNEALTHVSSLLVTYKKRGLASKDFFG